MTNDKMTLRNKLVNIALDWQENFGVAPSITSAISEYDAAMLIGMPGIMESLGRVERGSFTLTLSQNRA